MKRSAFLMFSAMSLCSANGYAAENNYVAADLMFLDMELSAENTSQSASPTAMQARVGSFLHEFIAVEGAVALGATDDNFSDNSTAELKTLFAINALGRLPLGQSAELFGRVGLAKMDVKIGGGTYNGTHDDTGMLYGIGIGVTFSRYSTLSMEFTQLPDVDVSGGTIETSSVNISYRVLF